MKSLLDPFDDASPSEDKPKATRGNKTAPAAGDAAAPAEGRDLLLNRRHLRVKVLQFLYAQQQGAYPSLDVGQTALHESLKNMHSAFLYGVYLVVRFADAANRQADARDSRMLATMDNILENRAFAENPLAAAIEADAPLMRAIRNRKFDNGEEFDDLDMLRSTFAEIAKTVEYASYQNADAPTPAQAAAVYTAALKRILPAHEPFDSYMQEHFLGWDTDQTLVFAALVRIVRSYADTGQLPPVPLALSNNEELQYALKLFKMCVLHESEMRELIGQVAENWDTERIALTDSVSIRMGIAELMYFPDIPVKVTLNEYVEMAKSFSTPKSKDFVNGVLDKAMKILKEQGRIPKEGRGLIG